MFNRAKRGLQVIIAKSKNASDQEKRVSRNVISSLATSLQELSGNFRKSQSVYLKSKKKWIGYLMCHLTTQCRNEK